MIGILRIFLIFLCSALLSHCKSIRKSELKVSEGAQVYQGELPCTGWLSAKFVSESKKNDRVCSASFFSGSFALTAAHCVSRRGEQLESLVLGSPTGEQIKIDVSQETVKVRPEYLENETVAFDLAVIKLPNSHPLPVCDNKKIINEKTEAERYIGQSVFLHGYGSGQKRLRADLKVNGITRHKDLGSRVDENLVFMEPIKASVYPTAGDSGSAIITTKEKILGIYSFDSKDYFGYVAVPLFDHIEFISSFLKSD